MDSKLQQEREVNGVPPFAEARGSASDRARLKAKMDGACAALEGRKLDANQYPEESELHFEWLAGWTSAKMEMRKTPNGRGERPGPNDA
jgi:hypothetical protein